MADVVIAVEGKVQVDKEELDRLPADAARVSAQMEKTPARIRAQMDTRPAMAGARDIHKAVKDVERTVITPRMNIGPASTELAKLRAEAAALAPQMRTLTDAQLAGSLVSGPAVRSGTSGSAVGSGAKVGGGFMALGTGSMLGGLAVGAGVMGAGIAARSMWDMAMEAQSKVRLENFTKRVYGSAGGTEFAAAAERMQETTGFQSSDVLKAVLAGQDLARTYSLQTSQIKQLVSASADLAATSPYSEVQTVTGAMERLSSALRGDNNAAQMLGMVLDDTHMKTKALGGTMRDTWDGMSEAAQFQARYNEALKQMSEVLGAAEDDEGLDSQLRKVKGELVEIGEALGRDLLPPLRDVLKMIANFIDSIPEWVWKLMGATARSMSGQGPEAAGTAMPIVNLTTTVVKYEGAKRLGLQYRDVMGEETLVDEFGNIRGPITEATKPAAKPKPWWIPTPMIIGETKIVLQDKTVAGVRVQDARSFAPSNV